MRRPSSSVLRECLRRWESHAYALTPNAPAPDFLRMALELGATRRPRQPFTPDASLFVVNGCLCEARSRSSKIVGGAVSLRIPPSPELARQAGLRSGVRPNFRPPDIASFYD